MKRMCSPMKQTGKSGRQSHSFLQGAVILTAGVLAVKLMGAVFKIPLNWVIGEDGMGYFTTAYSFYSPIYSLATAGFPIAISRLVSMNCVQKRYRDVRQIHRVSVPIFLLTGTLGLLVMLLGSGWYVRAMGNENALPCMLALAPAILFSCLSAIYRGYYEGLRNMAPTAISEILEALFRLALGLAASFRVMQMGMEEYARLGSVFGTEAASKAEAQALVLPWAAAGAIAGVTVGSIASFLFLLLRHKIRGDGITQTEYRHSPPPRKALATARLLLKTAVPIGLGAIAVNIAGLVDTTFLQAGIREALLQDASRLLRMYEGMIPAYNLENPQTIPNFLFGCYANAHTLFMLIPAVTQAFGVSALPNVTAAWTGGSRKKLQTSIESVIRMTALFSFPAGIGMAVLSQPIVRLLFGSRAAAPIIAGVLPVMAAGAVFASMSTPLQSMLQAVGRVDIPVKLLGVGLLLKAGLNYWLTALPEWNIMGAAVGTLACYVFIMVGALISLCRVTGIRPRFWAVLGKPLVSAGVCCASAFCAHGFLRQVFDREALALPLAVLVGVCFYVCCLFLMDVMTREEICQLPGGQKIIKLLEKRDGIE